ncbi:MbcA/ParS/Xre antitoxin family protein [Variovorax sp. J31P207]|nr:MbcA/ParS/Xre antitoxin family protein [Variovorax sp. J31P207]MDM0065289.1 MbcA/ParS/Xre antitoxin family protein [Variovorax sp. J31P207]
MVEVEASPSVDRVHEEKELLNLATEVFGNEAHAWLRKPHVLLGGQTPAEIVAAGGQERVQILLRRIQHGIVV